MSIKSQFNKIIKNIEGETEKIVRGTLLSTTGRIIKRTPVDTGRLRANWQSSIDVAATGELKRTEESKATAEANRVISRVKIGKVFYMSNNLPYAAIIENGGPRRTPVGMMRISVAETNAAIESGRKL